MKCGVVVFPGSNCDHDVYHVLKHVLGQETALPLASIDRPAQGLRPGGAAGRLLLRRLPARRGHGGAVADHGRGARARRGGRARARHLQRLPDPARGRTAARRDAAQPRPALPLPGRRICASSATDLPFTRALPRGPGPAHADRARRGLLHDSDGGARRARERPAGSSSATSTPDGALDRRRNPNGSARAIAGIANARGNVLGMMPHPERCAEEILGNTRRPRAVRRPGRGRGSS